LKKGKRVEEEDEYIRSPQTGIFSSISKSYDLEECKDELKETESKLQETDIKLKDVESKLKDVEARLQESEIKHDEKDDTIQRLRVANEKLTNTIDNMNESFQDDIEKNIYGLQWSKVIELTDAYENEIEQLKMDLERTQE
jgi:chromosome segregation ATPase